MLRDKNLVPLSHQHQHYLALCVRLDRAIQAGEVDMEALRVEIAGDLAYEAGRFKALVPSAVGKRREERGKYLWVCQRQTGGEWKIAADCWSSDLTLSNLESDVPSGAGVKTSQPRKNS